MSLCQKDEFFLANSKHSIAEANQYLKELLDKYYEMGYSKGYTKGFEDGHDATNPESTS